MTIGSGTRLGPYEIVAPIGAGGMGEVYRARDTRLDRAVAIKILPAEFAQNAKLRIRFDREAKTISRLSHPNICTLFDVGENFIVMELLEGESLADRIARGPLSVSETLKFGMQIADALGKAHREGVIHRDLKPGNVMLTKSGAKLLDFGLAKTVPIASSAESQTAQKPLTEEGAVVGTLVYMAPEQLGGEEPDARTDIFALGSVLYEMATGQRAFNGKTRTSVIGAIVSGEPLRISELQPMTPPALEHVVRKCLAKERDDRWQNASDVAEQLRWISEAGSAAGIATPIASRRKVRDRWAVALAALMTLSTAVLGTMVWRSMRLRPPVMRLTLSTPRMSSDDAGVAISPDGRKVVFREVEDGRTPPRLCLRSLASTEIVPLAGTENGWEPFFSPDGKYVGFFANGKLEKVNINGGPPQPICDAPSGRGATWGADGTIVFSPDVYAGLFKVPSAGGTPVAVTRVDPTQNQLSRWPSFLPDVSHFLYTFRQNDRSDLGSVMVGSIDSPAVKLLIDNAASAFYADPGWLFFVRAEIQPYSADSGTLMAVRFDAAKLKVAGEPIPLAKTWYFPGSLRANIAAVSQGPLLYRPVEEQPKAQMQWFDEGGRPLGSENQPAVYDSASISPDGKRVAFVRDNQIWIQNLGTTIATRLTFEGLGTINSRPVWSPDGKRVLYVRFFTISHGILCARNADGTGQEEVLYKGATLIDFDVSPDGKWVVIGEQRQKTQSDLIAIDLSSSRATAYLESPERESQPAFSPDGKWIAYQADNAIRVRRFPDSGDQWEVTPAGMGPSWSRDGKTIFYATPSGTMGVSVKLGTSFEAGTARKLFDSGDLIGTSADGKRYLMLVAEKTPSNSRYEVVLNWERMLENR